MALTFPLATSVFFDLIKVKTIEFDPQAQQEVSMPGSGAGVAKDLGPTLWLGKFTSNLLTHDQARQIKALIGAAGMSRFSFYAYDPRGQYPQSDPAGTILGGSSVQINSIDVSNVLLSLKGLPASYTITAGDYLSFDYGSPSSRALHQACETVTANGSGVTGLITVTPIIRLGAAVNAAVTLIKASCEMRLMPGSWKSVNQSRVKTVISFQAGQWINA